MNNNVLVGILAYPVGGGNPVSTVFWNDVINKPFYEIGENLKVEDHVLSVDTVDEVGDFTKPITATAVHTVVGNINVLLEAI